jgi:hypothetical protein
MHTATDQDQTLSDLASLSPTDLLALLAEKGRLIAERDQVIAERDHALVDIDRRLKEKHSLVKLLEEKVRLAKQRLFGASSEKLPFQGDFFDEAQLEQALSDVEQQLADAGEPRAKAPREPRQGFSDKLLRIRVDPTLGGADKAGASRTHLASALPASHCWPIS